MITAEGVQGMVDPRGLDRLGSGFLSQLFGQGRPRVSAALSSLRPSEAEPPPGLRRSLARTETRCGAQDRWRVGWLVLIVIGTIGQPAAASQDARTTRVSGQVFAADTGKPVRGAFVNLIDTRAANPTERQGRWIATDANGRWEFSDLPPGRYTLTVTKSGYLKIEYGQQRPFERGKTLELAAGQVLDKVNLAVPRGSAITG